MTFCLGMKCAEGDCSLEETAGAMGKKVNAIKVLQHRALAAMKRHLTQGGRA